MKDENIKDYIGALLNNPEVDEKTLGEVKNAKLLLTAYRLGLEGKPFDVSLLRAKLVLEEDIPAPYRQCVAQMAILLSDEKEPRAIECLFNSVDRLLRDFRNHFSPRSC